MWIEILDNGKYKYIERYNDPLTGKKRKVSLTHTKNNNRIEKEMFINLQEKIEKKLKQSNANINFRTLSEKWLSVYIKQVKESTYNSRTSYIIVINRDIGDILLEQLKAAHINTAILNLFNAGYGYDTVRGMVSCIRNVLRFGFKYGFLADREILNGIEIPKINVKEKDEFKYLEREELNTVVRQLKENGYGEISRMCLIQTYTGMRYGEMIGLDYTKHIDFKEQKILIERTWYHRKKKFQSPKSGKPRTIHFNNETALLLKEQIQFTKLKVMQRGLDKSKKLLFINYHSDPFTNSYTNELLGKYAVIPNKHVTTHIFRHTFITLLIEQGVELALIAKHVGHSNTNMIQRIYAHFTNKMDSNLKDAINDFSISL